MEKTIMASRRPILLVTILLLMALTLTACQGQLDGLVGGLNSVATAAAGGEGANPGADVEATATEAVPATETPIPATATPSIATFDLTTDPGALLVRAWGQNVYTLPPGTEFEIRATEAQVAAYVIGILQLDGFEENVRGGQALIGSGQVRLDMALVGTDGDFAGGTITFQPTLDDQQRLRLNPLGGDFGGLTLPPDLLSDFGDAVYTAMTGAANHDLAKVTLTGFSLDDGVMVVRGTVR